MASNWARIILWGSLALFIGFILYSAFIKPTHSQKTNQNADRIINHYYWENAKISGFCVNLKAEKQREIK